MIVNGVYKVCDFGEAKVTQGNDVIRQTIKGTELYMSPILFRALNKRQKQLKVYTYPEKTHPIYRYYELIVFVFYSKL